MIREVEIDEFPLLTYEKFREIANEHHGVEDYIVPAVWDFFLGKEREKDA